MPTSSETEKLVKSLISPSVCPCGNKLNKKQTAKKIAVESLYNTLLRKFNTLSIYQFIVHCRVNRITVK